MSTEASRPAGKRGCNGENSLRRSGVQCDESIDIGFEKLMTEHEAIEALGLKDRPNPSGALRWLIRQKRLGHVRLGRGVLRFRPCDIKECIERSLIEAN